MPERASGQLVTRQLQCRSGVVCGLWRRSPCRAFPNRPCMIEAGAEVLQRFAQPNAVPATPLNS